LQRNDCRHRQVILVVETQPNSVEFSGSTESFVAQRKGQIAVAELVSIKRREFFNGSQAFFPLERSTEFG